MSSFASELKILLSKTEVKNASIAEAVQYDSSYISKWLSGRIIPSQRYVDKIAAQIARCVVEGSGSDSLAVLQEEYAAGPGELEAAIAERLLSAYRGESQTVQEIHFQPDGTLLPLIKSIPWNGKATVVADLFSMDHESRLLLAGIRHGRFVDLKFPAVKLVVDLDQIRDPVYDAIFLVHMLTSYSGAQVGLYHNAFARGKFLYADQKQFISALLTDESHCLSVTRQEHPETAAQFKRSLNAFCTQETLLVQPIGSLLEGHLYMQSLLSSQHLWLTGHFTEQMIPQELFAQLCGENQELSRIGSLLQSCSPKLLVYRSAFSKLMISGELDFFNQKVVLTPRQQLACLDYVRQLVRRGSLRMVDGGFSADFQYITDPCVFLSDTVAYLRLENGSNTDNLLNITDRKLKAIYTDFFCRVWEDNPMVIREEGEMLRILDAFMAQLEALL